ncbi:MAG: hypothetical protein AB1631_22865 [Acidobacteriota bacterium]
MKNKHILAVMIAALAMVFSAGKCSFSTARISDVKMGKAVNDKFEVPDPTTTFDANEKSIHCVVYLSNAPDGTKVKAQWIAVNAEGYKSGEKLFESDLDMGGPKNVANFSITPPASGLGAGEYKVDLFLNPDPAKPEPPTKSVSFTVKAIPAEIVSAYLATDQEGNDRVTEFPAGTTAFYCFVQVKGKTAGTKVSASWVGVEAAGVPPGNEIKKTDVVLKGEQNIAYFSLTLPGGFPPGNYRVDLLLGGSLTPSRSLAFSVAE